MYSKCYNNSKIYEQRDLVARFYSSWPSSLTVHMMAWGRCGWWQESTLLHFRYVIGGDDDDDDDDDDDGPEDWRRSCWFWSWPIIRVVVAASILLCLRGGKPDTSIATLRETPSVVPPVSCSLFTNTCRLGVEEVTTTIACLTSLSRR